MKVLAKNIRDTVETLAQCPPANVELAEKYMAMAA